MDESRPTLKLFAWAMADFQSRLLINLFYITLFMPFALATRLLSNPLEIKKRNAAWKKRRPSAVRIEDALRQF